MITSYGTFNSNLEKMIKIRSANYAETDCDIAALIETVYEDIQNDVLVEIYKQEVITDGSQEIILSNFNSTVSTEITEKYTDVLDIVNEYDTSIIDLIYETEDGVYRWKDGACNGLSSTGEYPTDISVFFIRKKISSIETLKPELYSKLTKGMLEGVMYFIQTALPNQVDGQVGNFSYQRFFNEKKELMNKQPQYQYRLRRDKRWQ